MSLGQAFSAAVQEIDRNAAFRAAGLSLVAPLAPAEQEDAVLARAAVMDVGVEEQHILAGQRSGSTEGQVNLSASASGNVAKNVQEKSEKEAKDRASDAILMALLADIDRQIAANKDKIHENEQLIETLNEEINALQNAINRLGRGEELALNANGSFVDVDLEQAVKRFEDKYGVIIDRGNPDTVLLQPILKAAQEEKARLAGENLSLERKNEVLEAEREIAISSAQNNPGILFEMAQDKFSSEEQERILERGTNEFEHKKFMEFIEERGFSKNMEQKIDLLEDNACLLYTSPSPRDRTRSRMPSSA